MAWLSGDVSREASDVLVYGRSCSRSEARVSDLEYPISSILDRPRCALVGWQLLARGAGSTVRRQVLTSISYLTLCTPDNLPEA